MKTELEKLVEAFLTDEYKLNSIDIEIKINTAVGNNLKLLNEDAKGLFTKDL